MNGENRPLVADELVEVEKQLVQVHQDFRIITDRFRRIDGIHLKLIKTNQEITTSVRGDFWAYSVKNLVFPSSTGDMFDILWFFFINLRYVL
jgi:hypothetical protein